MANTIGYLIASDFSSDGMLNKNLLPAFVMIKAGSCRFCQITEPLFRKLAEYPRDFNLFFMRPFDGRDVRERDTKQILYDIIETSDFGFPAFVFFTRDGKKITHIGAMSLDDMLKFVQTSDAQTATLEATKEPPSFKPYNI